MTQLDWGDTAAQLRQRLYSRASVRTQRECWWWSGMPDSVGYGRMCWGGKQVRTHRLSWIAAHGPIPDGMCVLHHCDNRMCINPDHLFLGTHTDNIADMVAKGRNSLPPRLSGEAHSGSKLTRASVAAIRARAMAGETQRALAHEFGVSEAAVSALIHGKTWRAA